MDIQKIISRPLSETDGAAALAWGRGQVSRVLRGDLMIGIMDEEDHEAIVPALDYAARCGVPGAWRELADFYLLEGRSEAAAQALQEALSAEPSASVDLVRLLWFHLRDQVDGPQAARAAQALQHHAEAHPDDAEALYLLGLITWGGFGSRADQAAGAEVLRRAADLHSADAQFELYVLYSTGQGVRADEDLARQYLEAAADGGQPRATYNLGALYATGQGGFPPDMEQAVVWYARAAHKGHARAARTLATMSLLGAGIDTDLAQGREFLELAEELGEDMDDLRDFLPDDETDSP